MKVLKSLLKIFTSFILVIVLLCALVLAYVGYTSSGQQQLTNLLNKFLSNDTQTIEISPIQGGLSGEITIDKFTVTEKDQPNKLAVLNNIDINWNPWALFSGKLDISLITVSSTKLSKPSIERNKTTSPDKAPFTLANLPMAVEINQWSFDEIILSPDIMGATATLSSSGALAVTSNKLTVNTIISRIDAVEGIINANIAYIPMENILDLNIRANEPKQGLITHFLKLPSDSATTLQLNGQGNIQAWQGALKLSLDETMVTELTLLQTLKPTSENHIVSVTGNTQLATLLQGQLPAKVIGLADILAGKTAINIQAEINPLNLSVPQLDAKLANRNWLASAVGDYNINKAHLQSNLQSSSDTALSLTLENKALSVNNISLALAKVDTEVDAQLRFDAAEFDDDNYHVKGLQADINLDVDDINIQNIDAKITGAIGSVTAKSLSEPALTRLLSTPLNFSSKANYHDNVITAEDFTLKSKALGADIKVTGNYSLDQKDFSAKLLSTLAAESFADIPGYQKLADLGIITLKSRVSGNLSTLLTQTITAKNSTTLDINNVELVSQALSLKGAGSIKDNKIDLTASSQIANAAIIHPDLVGALQLESTVMGQLDNFTLQTSLTSSQLSYKESSLQQVDANVDAKIVNNALNGNLTLTANHQGEAISLATHITQQTLAENTGWRLDNTRFRFADNAINGDLFVNNAFVPSGKLHFSLPDLQALGALANQQISGSVGGKINLANTNPESIEIVFNGNNISVQNMDIPATQGEVSVQNWKKQPRIDGTVIMPSLSVSNQNLTNITLDLATSDDKTSIDAGFDYLDETISIQGQLIDSNGSRLFNLQRFSGNYQGIPIKLEKPTAFDLNQGIQFSDLDLLISGGNIKSSGRISNNSSAAIQLNNIDIGQLTTALPDLKATGKINGNITLSGQANNPEMLFDLQLKNFNSKLTADNGMDDLIVATKGSVKNKTIYLDTDIHNKGGLKLNANGDINLESFLLDIVLTGELPLKLMAVSLAKNNIAVKGNLLLDLTASGSALDPNLRGTISSSDINVYDGNSGITFAPITIDGNLEGKTLLIKKIVAPLSTGGRLVGSGELITNIEENLPIKTSLQFIQTNFTDGDIIDTIINGEIILNGELLGDLTVGGLLELNKTHINIPEVQPSSVSKLEVTHKNSSQEILNQWEQVRQKSSNKKSKPINLDISIKANNQIFLRGRGINAELSGEVRLKGNSLRPTTEGALQLTRGRIIILEKRLDLTEGRVNFFGSLIPQLDLTAEQQGKNALITVTVKGSADDPEVSFSSVPFLPQDELVAQLLFTRSLNQLSPLQYAQLADAIAKLTGSDNGLGLNVADKLRDAINVDDVDLKTDPETGDVSLVIGKYINDRTYVTVEQGGSAESGKATIDLQIGRGIKLHGEAVQTGEAKLGLYYEKEY